MTSAYLCIWCRAEPSLAGQLYGSGCMLRFSIRHKREIDEVVDWKFKGNEGGSYDDTSE